MSPPLPQLLSPAYKLYPRRWLTLALFSLATLTNASLWTTFAPISDLTSTYFFDKDNESTTINNLALTYQVLYLPGTALGEVKDGEKTAVAIKSHPAL